MPHTKPDLILDEEGICNACRSYESRKTVDWDRRYQQLKEIVDRYKRKDQTNWDCIVPVSGGKDSTYQVIKILELGLNPLCVTATTCDLTEIGRKNIENIKHLGVDYIEVSPNPLIRAKLNYIGLREVGDISWPEHVSIFTVPVRVAVDYKIPLIIWGENSQNEFGGPASAAENNILNRRWLEEFGGLLGLRVSDLIGIDGIEARHLINYTYPSDEDLQRVGVTGLFLGYYLPWDGLSNFLLAQTRGFSTYPSAVEGSSVNYENLDNFQTAIHEYFKFIKFGFGRATDICSLHIRRGRMTREDGLLAAKLNEGKFPWTYMGKPLEKTLEPLGIDLEKFTKICDQFTNKKLFIRNDSGQLLKDSSGTLKKINYDNL